VSPGDDRRRGPLLGRLVLRLTLPRDRRADVAGDLGELYTRRRQRGRIAAWWWYWRQVFDLVGRFAWERRAAGPLAGRAAGASRRTRQLLAWSDFKLAVRMMGKTPALTLVAVLAMAVGIGLAVCGFSLLQAVFHAELPLPEGDRIVRLEDYHRGGFPIRSDAEVFERRRRGLTAFEQVVGYEVRRVGVTVPGGDGQQVVSLAYVTPDMLAMVGVAPRIGPGFRRDDSASTSPAVVLLGDDLWRALGADDGIVGETLLIDGTPHRVTGVMPAGFRFPTGQQAWVPIELSAVGAGSDPQRLWTAAKLRAGVDLSAAAAEWATVAAREPAQGGYELDDLRPRVVSFTRPGNETETIAVAAAAFFALVLLVIAANVSNLFLARTAGRMNEMAVRVALGGGRGRIIAQLFLEALAVGGIAALLAVAISRPVLAWFQVHGDMPWWTEFRLDPGVLLLALAATVIASAIAGVPPALRATSRGLEGVLRDGSGAATGLRFGRLSQVLLVAQVTLSVGLLSAAGLVGLGLFRQAGQDFGVPVDSVVVAQVYWGQPAPRELSEDAAGARERFEQRAAAGRERLEERLRALPGVVAVSSATGVPGQHWIGWSDHRLVDIDGESGARPRSTTDVIEIGPHYFATYDATLLAGRDFDSRDYQGAARTVIVNEPFVRDHLAGPGNPIGRRIRFAAEDRGQGAEWGPWLEVVGVVPDLGVDPMDPRAAAAVYVPLSAANIALVSVRSHGDLARLTPLLYEATAGGGMPAEVQAVYTLAELIEGPAGPLRLVGRAALFVGGIALLLSACGLYAVMSFTVARRTREIGIRRALGARNIAVVRAVLGGAALPLLAGALLGASLGGATIAVVTRLLPLKPLPAVSFLTLAVITLMLVVGALGCLVPLRRVLAVRPVDALRHG